jgi:hypothetical protein
MRETIGAGWSAVPAAVALILIILWSAHDGGFDADTWYWGALIMLAILAATVMGAFGPPRRPSRATTVALAAFSLYVLWSYASIAWAGYQGAALTGSNRALLYLLIFASLSLVDWTPRRGLWMLVAYALGVGAIAVVMLLDMAQGQHVGSFFSEGRLITPTGYFNSNAALFMMLALVAASLSVRRELPAVLRGVLLALACAGLQLALLAESRGWLFTLPLVILIGLLATRHRLAVSVAALVPIAGMLAVLSPLLDVYRVSVVNNPSSAVVTRAAEHAGRMSLLLCGAVLVTGTLGALLGPRVPSLRPSRTWRNAIGAAAAVIVIAVAAVGGNAATHGHPIRFINKQWYGFTHPGNTTTTASGSHFAAVGTERYDAWRVSLDAFVANPIGGLGQDNFADYYVLHRHTGVELEWTHSIEMRLLAHTGAVGFLAFVVFLVAAVAAALRVRGGSDSLAAGVAATALLPVIVWLVHGSVDWFWEIPALSGPALGFLAMAGSLAARPPSEVPAGTSNRRRAAAVASGIPALLAAVVVLGLPYLSVREVSIGSDLRGSNPTAALAAFNRAGQLNPLDSDPGRFGGTLALQDGQYEQAVLSFRQAIAREPGGWFPWLGAGLAESALGHRARARHYFAVAASINSKQPAVTTALARGDSAHPLTPQAAINLLVLAH